MGRVEREVGAVAGLKAGARSRGGHRTATRQPVSTAYGHAAAVPCRGQLGRGRARERGAGMTGRAASLSGPTVGRWPVKVKKPFFLFIFQIQILLKSHKIKI
jgi:hypothetical protein